MPSSLPVVFCISNAGARFLSSAKPNYAMVALAVEAVIKISWYVYFSTVTWFIEPKLKLFCLCWN